MGSHRIALASWGGQLHTVHVWDVRDRHEVFALPPCPGCYAVAFSPDGRYLVRAKGSSGVVEVWDAQERKHVATLGTHKREIRGLAFSPDHKHLVSASDDGKVKVWDATRLDKNQDARHTLSARVPGPSLNVAFSRDGWLATGGEENTVQIWNVETGEELRPPLRGHNGEVYALAVSPDGRWLASGGEDSEVKVWDTHNKFRLARNLRGHTGLVSSLAFSPKGGILASGSRDRTVKVWDVSKLGAAPNGN
jgi:WD40 repeat protein